MGKKKYLKDTSVAQRFDVDRSTIWRWVKEGRLPQPVRRNGITRWRKSDLKKWEKQSNQIA